MTATVEVDVLVVDDEAMVRKYVSQVLELHGYRVTCAGDAQEALCLLENGLEMQLMVTDLVMPGKNGRQLAEEVRRLRPHVEILFISGYTEDAAFRRGLLNTEVQFLPKPFTPSHLIEKVKLLLNRQNQRPSVGRCAEPHISN